MSVTCKMAALAMLIVMALCWCTPVSANANDGVGEDISIGKRIVMQSDVLKEEREILVNLPNRYDQTDGRYPVLYLLDGDQYFHFSTGVIQFLSRHGRMPEVILIGIPNTDRTRDFTPTHTDQMPASGGADDFLRWLDDELFPFVEETYRTEPFRILVGHSLCGMFGIYTMLREPGLFDAYIAISPWLAYDNQFLIAYADTVLRSDTATGAFLYVTVGGNEQAEVKAGTYRMMALLEEKAPEGLDWEYHVMEGHTHGSLLLKSLYNGLEVLYHDWPLPDEVARGTLAGLCAHYATLSERYGYDVTMPELVLNVWGYRALQEERYDEAFEAFTLNVRLHPESANVYDSLGEALEAIGNPAEARENYELAVEKGTATEDPNLPLYRDHVKRVLERTD